MKITRRLFIQLTSAAVAFITSPFKTKAAATVTPAAIQITPHKSVCHIYNPGLDIEGVRIHVFGQMNVIKGGMITRIEQGEEQLLHRPTPYSQRVKNERGIDYRRKLPDGRLIFEEDTPHAREMNLKGLWRDETTKIKDGYRYEYEEGKFADISPEFEDRFCVVHPASEIVESLQFSNPKGNLVHIKEWDNRPVDLKSINELLSGKNLPERIKAIENLPKAAWRMTSVLRSYLYPVLKNYLSFVRTEIEEGKRRLQTGQLNCIDPYTRNLHILANESIMSRRAAGLTSTQDTDIAGLIAIIQKHISDKPKSNGWASEGGEFAKPDDYEV